jgi:hypothetical protein
LARWSSARSWHVVKILSVHGGLAPIMVPVLPLPQHIAEKVHAYTRSYGPHGQSSSRVKDLVDLVLIQANQSFEAGHIRRALEAVFAARLTHDLPPEFGPPPRDWRQPYRELAAGLTIPSDLDEGYRLTSAFLTPILDGTVDNARNWDSERGRWT